MAATNTEFNVQMSCDGCAKAVTNALKKVNGVTNVECNVSNQKVVVTGTASVNDMLEAVKKTGKQVYLIN